jgi:hypothetical protein
MNIDKSITSFHLALQNVTYEIERTTNTERKIPSLELVTVNAHMDASDSAENVSNDSAEANVKASIGHSSSIASICPQLQKELDLVSDGLEVNKKIRVCIEFALGNKH